MTLYSGPAEHAANPPSTWAVTKAAERIWRISDKTGTVLDTFTTKRAALAALSDGTLVRMWHNEARWYAGETAPHKVPYIPAAVRAADRAHPAAEHTPLKVRIEYLMDILDAPGLTVETVPADTLWPGWYSHLAAVAITLDGSDHHAARIYLTRRGLRVTDHHNTGTGFPGPHAAAFYAEHLIHRAIKATAAGCSCGMDDWGAPGHDGGPEATLPPAGTA